MDYFDNNEELSGHDVLQKWFSSDTWTCICESEDDDSIELMEQVSSHLESLIFHLNNDSGDTRVQYELKYFTDLCDKFEISLW